MLTTATKDKLKKLGIDVAALEAAAKADTETDVTIPDGDVFTKTDLDTRDRTKYEEGKKAGEELAVDAVKKANNLEFTGKKVEGLVKHLTEKSAPDETETVTKLRGTITKLESEKAKIEGDFGSLKVRTNLIKIMPPLNNGMNHDEAIAIMTANGFEIKDNKGILELWKNGAIVVDEKLQTPLSADVAVKNFFTEKKWVGVTTPTDPRSGRGGANTTPANGGVVMKLSEFSKTWQENNPEQSTNGEKYQLDLMQAVEGAKTAGQTFSLSE